MMGWLAAFLGLDPQAVQLLTALIGLVAATATTTSTVHGILNRRMRKRTEVDAKAAKKTADSTAVALQSLLGILGEQKRERDELWTAYLQKDTIANPDGVRRIATETAAALTERELLPMRQYFAATEIVESRREHRPETDVIRVLQEITA